MFKKIVNYCKTCYEELAHKTTWPTRKALTHSEMCIRDRLRARQQYDKPSVLKRLKMEHAIYVQQLRQTEE